MGEILTLLQDLGLPTGVAAGIVLGVIAAGAILKRRAEGAKAHGDESRAERQLLTSDQAAFRQSLFSQIATLQKELSDSREAEDAAVARHMEAERRVVESQLALARLAAALIASGVTLPSSAVADLGISSPQHRPAEPAKAS